MYINEAMEEDINLVKFILIIISTFVDYMADNSFLRNMDDTIIQKHFILLHVLKIGLSFFYYYLNQKFLLLKNKDS